MSSTPTTKRRRGAVVATLAVASMGLLAGFAPAASAHPGGGRPQLTDEQKTCLEEQGIEKPARGEDGRRVRPTDEQKAAFEAAAAECGIELPERPSDAPSDNGTTGDTQAENTDAS